MSVKYDEYYQTENLFGAPYPELIEFYLSIEQRGKLLDLGCGQGRDAIALARIGYEVTGIDHSKVGIDQLNEVANEENLPLTGVVGDMYAYNNFNEFDFILLDSLFHFGKKERQKEIKLLKKIIDASKANTLITICIQKTGNKLAILNSILSGIPRLKTINQNELIYIFEDKEANHRLETTYQMISVKKR